MKELSLSLLSRGCGQLVSIHKDSGGHDGRVDVCLTPQDYYMWRYHGSAVRLSNSGHLFGGTETALPKTYSTRRGPLVLYSQDLVCVATACHAEPKDRKRRAYQQTEQEVDQRLCTVSDLTEAIYYRNKQIITSRVTPSFLPPLRSCPVTDTRPVTPPLSQRRRSGFHLVLQTPRVSGLCTPQTESRRQLPNTREMCDVTRDTQRMGTEGRRMAGERDHGPAAEEHLESGLKTESEQAPWTPSQLPRVTFYEGHHPDHPTERTEPCPPPLCLRPMVSSTHFNTGETAPSGPSAPITQEWAQRAWRLPPIPENQDGSQETGAAERQPEGGKMRRGLLADKDSMILLELQSEHPPPVGVLRSIAGRRGPGRQSALACFHLRPSDLQDALESEDRGVVRGMLPQELTEFDTGRRFGCLIMGPDGEIIQVSLNDDLRNNPHDPSQPVAQEASSHLDDVTQDNRDVIQLLSPEGEKLPWVLILTPEQTHTEEGVVGNPDDPTDRITASHPSNTSHKIKKRARQIATDRQVDSSVTHTSKPGARQNSHLHKTTGTDTGSTNSHRETAPVAINLETTHPSSLRAEERTTGERKVARQASRRHLLIEEGGKEEGQEEKEEEDTCKSANRRSARQRETAPPPGNKRNTKSITRPTSSKRYSKTTALPPQEDTVEEEEDEEGDRKHTSKERRNKTHVNAVDDNKKKMRLGRSDDQPIRSKSDREGGIRKPIESQSSPSAPTRTKKTLRGKREDGGAKAEERGTGSVGEQVVSDRRRKRRSRKQKEVPGGEPIDIEKHAAAETEAGGRLSLVSGAARAWSASRETSCSGHTESESESDARRETDGETGTDRETQAGGDPEQDGIHLSEDKRGSVRSRGSRSSASTVSSSQWSFHRSTPSWEGAGPETGAANSRKASTMRDRMSSSCSTIMVPEEQLTLNPVRSESPRLSLQQQAAVARQAQQRAAAAQLVEVRREEAERTRRERQEQERKKQERGEREGRMRLELEEDRKKREEEQSLSRLAEEEERRRREEQERERARREQEQRERERRRQEDKRRQMELLRRRREEEEQRRAAEHEHQRQEEAKRRQEEERRREEESRMLLQMDETEREEYLRRQREEQEERRRVEMERRCREEETLRWAQEEARAQAELFFRQRLVLERQLAFQRGLAVESRGLDQTQDISRPWVYSYFTLLDLLGLSAPDPDNTDL